MTNEITPEEIHRFYKEKNISNGCPTCGKTEWILATAPNGWTWNIGSAHSDGGLRVPTPHLPTLVLMCVNCFTLRTHSMVALRKWFEDHPSKGAANG